MNTSAYNTLVDRTYIDSIRSVIMIDDQFPTYTKLLEKCDNSNTTTSAIAGSTKKYLEILSGLCQKRHWTYHIEDNLPAYDASRGEILHNSDLIFLDFKLGVEDDGEKAISAIRDYSHSGRFNFIVVYTEENISKVFAKIVVTLGWREMVVDEAVFEKISEIDIDHSGFSAGIETIARENYFQYIINSKEGKRLVLEQIRNKLSSINISCDRTANECTQWALAKIANDSPNKAGTHEPINGEFKTDCNWLRIGHLFLTVIAKSTEDSEDDLYRKIVSATHEWNPSPGQLIMKDAKNQIDDFCFFDLFPSEKQEVAWFNFTYISPQKFMQGNDILHNLIDLVKFKLENRLHSDLNDLAKDKKIQDFYPSYSKGNENTLFHDINIYNSNLTLKKELPTHFSTGMIFKDIKDIDRSYWICMTQACDLEPSQNSLKWAPGAYKPITFVKLHPQTMTKALANATRGNTVFFEDGDEKKTLCIIEESSAGMRSNPHYETFFAPQRGKIDSPLSIPIYRVETDSSTTKLTFTEYTFSFIAQLRQEYASMLLQKISNHRARTPVNYISTP